MTIELKHLVSNLTIPRTVLLFGAGSSIPSNAPSVSDLQQYFEQKFSVPASGYSLAEQTAIIEHQTRDRARLIAELRSRFRGLQPTGALLNLPLYDWKSIFTTNYDTLIEESYKRRSKPYAMYSSNFDFGPKNDPDAVQIFKLHGTIDKDVSDGDHSRIILTENDYDLTSEFRDQLFDRLKADIAGCHLIILGHSLADPDIKSIVDRAVLLNSKSGGGGQITLFSYTRDEGRAALFESRGLTVCFGGLDNFFAELTTRLVHIPASAPSSGDPLDLHPGLRPMTTDAAHQLETGGANVSAMFNGWPASFSDIAAGLTFARRVSEQVADQFRIGGRSIAILLGPAGVGKTTAARQALSLLMRSDYFCWEHKPDHSLSWREWRKLASHLKANSIKGCLLIDDAHAELPEVNDLIDGLSSDDNDALKLILISSSGQWHPRIKSPALHRRSQEYLLSRVSNEEIERLLDLAQNVPDVRNLVEENFSGFSRSERKRRLTQRCEADMFVCLKNIFAFDSFDDIILREYAALETPLQDIYKIVAAMEWAGVHVHRQLIIRMLGIPAMRIGALLNGLSDIVHEQTISEREGIYAWKGRHLVIMGIVAQQKYYSENSRFELFKRVVESISPTYDIEIRTIRELCNVETGLATLTDKKEQNTLLRMMLSVAPKERVPRHRLIRNLITLGEYDQAETEIRLFERDFRLDGPAARYKIDLAVARAVRSPGLMDEDRVVLLDRARELASASAQRFKLNKAVLTAYCEVGLEIARLTKKDTVFQTAIQELKDCESKTADADISRRIARLESRVRSILIDGNTEFSQAEIEDE
ncbi:hypothetical protein ABIF68_002531 [Bradyrhizobium japonicum]